MVLLLTKGKGTELDINGLASACFVFAPVWAELSLLLSEFSRKTLRAGAYCTNKNSFPHVKFKWRTEKTFQMLHLPVLGHIGKYQTKKNHYCPGNS